MENYKRTTYVVFWFTLLCFSFLNLKLLAQTKDSNIKNDKDTSYFWLYKRLPILNNFRFIPNHVVTDPFINTFINLNAGSGLALDLKSYVKNLQGEVFDTLSGDLSYLSGSIEFQYAVNDWLAFSGSFGGSGRMGSNWYTILTSGVSYTTGYSLGGKIRIWENNKMFLAGTIDFSSQDIALYSIYDFVKEVYYSGGDLDSAANSLLEKDNTYLAFINANYAYAPTDWCGITAVAGWGISQAFQTKERGNFRIGATFSIDFDNVEFIKFPIGIVASSKYNTYAETGSISSNIFMYGFKIAYTGHKDFDIGIENTYQTVSYSLSEEKVNTILTTFNLRYYF